MELNKPKRLVAVLNGFEIGVESPKSNQDAMEFETFCNHMQAELGKLIVKPEVKS